MFRLARIAPAATPIYGHRATPPQPGKRPHETRNVCARGRQGSGRPALTITRPRPPKDLPFPCQKLLGPANSPPARSRRRGLWHQGRGEWAVRSVEMMRTAQMIVEECVALRPGEQVAVIGDTETVPIAEVLAQAAPGAGGEGVVCIMIPRAQHGHEPPPILAAAMQASDVMLMAVTHSITHTTARKEASARGARACVLRSVTIEDRKSVV